MEELVPVSSITKAVRLSYTFYKSFGKLGPGHDVFTLLDQVIHEGSEPLPLEIVDGINENFDWPILRSEKVPRLATVKIVGNLEWLPSYASSIQFLKLDVFDWDVLEPSQPCLRFSQLTSLCLSIDSFEQLLGCTFPTLKHFCFHFDLARVEASDLITALKVMDGNLVMLLDYSELSEDTLPNEIWSLCPKLQSFGTSLRWPADPYLPPSLCEFHLPFGIIRENYLPIDVIPIDALRKAGITVVCFGWMWLNILEGTFHDVVMDYVIYLLDHDISPHDSALVKFQDFIVRLLQTRKENISTYSILKDLWF
jgi:hypothetical protein